MDEAAAYGDPQAVAEGVVEAGDPDPGVARGIGELLRGGDMVGAFLQLRDAHAAGVSLRGDDEVVLGLGVLVAVPVGSLVDDADGVPAVFSLRHDGLDQAQCAREHGLGEVECSFAVAQCGDDAVGLGQAFGDGDRVWDRESPRGDVLEADLVAAFGPTAFDVLACGQFARAFGGVDPGRPVGCSWAAVVVGAFPLIEDTLIIGS